MAVGSNRRIGSGRLPAPFLFIIGSVVLSSLPPYTSTALPKESAITLRNASDRLDFIHRGNGGDGLAGAAWFDYNNDGFLDLYLANGKGYKNGLFRNNGDGTFTNVSAQAGVENGLGNSGVVAGDIDNDGYVDLFLTGEGGVLGTGQSPTRLYHNNRDGTFTDITTRAGVVGAESAWSAAFGDVDNDGLLDLFIASPGRALVQQHRNKLYRNNGDLTFTDISASAGVDTALGGCAVGFSDYDNDGWVDLFVANCGNIFDRPTPIELFHNNRNLTFTEVRKQAGLDLPGFWMGLAFGDYDNDGDMDFFATNFGTASVIPYLHALFRNNGDGTFTNVADRTGLAPWEWGWGCSFADFDNDGHVDLIFAGSYPPFPFFVIGPGIGNPGRVFLNVDNKDKSLIKFRPEFRFELGDKFTSGVAVADFDNNGFPDFVIAVDTYRDQIGRPVLYQNMGNDNKWLTIKTVGTKSNRDGVGARVKVVAGDLRQLKEVRAGSSFLSMDSPWLTFGLGQLEKADLVEITWPSGLVERFQNIPSNQTITLVEGKGIAESGRHARSLSP